jgi:hypothetical protein
MKGVKDDGGLAGESLLFIDARCSTSRSLTSSSMSKGNCKSQLNAAPSSHVLAWKNLTSTSISSSEIAGGRPGEN